MFRIQSSFNGMFIDAGKARSAFDERLQTIQREAARAWLREVLQHVPTWTGTARGTFLSLGSVIRVAVPIRPIKFLPEKGPLYGVAKSSFEFTASGYKYHFIFNQDLSYFLLNDFNVVTGILSTPWHSFDQGEAAWNIEVASQLRHNMPGIAAFVRFGKVRNG